MPGSFIIRPTSLISGGTPLYDLENTPATAFAGWVIDLTDLPSNTILEAVNSSGLAAIPPINLLECVVSTSLLVPSLSFIQVLRFGLLGASIYLDGSGTPIALSALPPGFTPTSASVLLGIPDPPNITDQPVSGSSQCFLQQALGNNGALNSTSFPYSPVPSMAAIVNNGIGISANINVGDANDVGDIVINDLRIEGIYITVLPPTPYQYNIQPSASPITVGDPITITSAGPNALNLANISSINITYYNASNVLQTVNVTILTQTQYSLTFNMPNFGAGVAVTINAVGNGTQFSGSVPLGTLLTINFTDGSGIYQLVDGKTNDTLYAQGTNPIQTVDIAIPNPFIKTGFIP